VSVTAVGVVDGLAMHGGWRCTGWRCKEGVVDCLALHGKLLRPRLGASTGGVLVIFNLQIIFCSNTSAASRSSVVS